MVRVEPVGAVLAVAGLIAVFKGAVDGYLLIESFFDKDNGSGYLTLRYRIEKHKLIIWEDFFKTSDPASYTLDKQPKVVKQLVLRIFAEINKTHEEAEPVVKKHDLVLSAIPAGELDKNLAADSQMAKDISNLSLAKKPKGQIGWVIKKKDKFAELVSKLQELNRDLYDILHQQT